MIRPDEYWAGQADGDGSIGIKSNHGQPVPRFAFKTTCEMTVRAFCKDMGVGTVIPCYPPSSRKPNWKMRWAFDVTHKAAVTVIRRLQPYLIEKAQTASQIIGECQPLPRGDAYWAGLVDAEGHIALSPNNGRKRPFLCVKMVDEATVTAMHQAMGIGSLFNNWSPSAQASGRQPQWTYKVSTQKAIVVLNRLRPYLLTKAAAADHVLAYYLTNPNQDRKLNREKRNDIRQRYAAGEKQVVLAAEYGINHVTISEICRGRIGVND